MSDVVQDVLVEANRRLQDYLGNPAMPFHLWLRQIAQDASSMPIVAIAVRRNAAWTGSVPGGAGRGMTVPPRSSRLKFAIRKRLRPPLATQHELGAVRGAGRWPNSTTKTAKSS